MVPSRCVRLMLFNSVPALKSGLLQLLLAYSGTYDVIAELYLDTDLS